MHLPTRLFSGELPEDRDAIAIDASISGFGLTAQRNDVPLSGVFPGIGG